MPSDGERLATLEACVDGFRDDMADLKTETLRTRTRLHDLEGIAGLLVNQERTRNRDTQRNQRRTERRLQVLTVVIAAATLLGPLFYHLAGIGA